MTIPADVSAALGVLSATSQNALIPRLERLCNGDWRRVVPDGHAAFRVVNKPQLRHAEVPTRKSPTPKPRPVQKREEPREVIPFRNTDCPRPEKYVYPKKEDAEERRLLTWADDPTMNSYLCACGFWHLGHSRELEEALQNSV